MNYKISYYYNENEKRKAYYRMPLPPFSFYLFSFLFFCWAIILFCIELDNESGLWKTGIFIFESLLLVFSIFFALYAPKHSRKMKEFFSGEQIIEISGVHLVYKSGEHELNANQYDTGKIVRNDLFYIINLTIGIGHPELNKYLSMPQIPIRCISEEDIIQISKSLKVPYDNRGTFFTRLRNHLNTFSKDKVV